MDLGVIVPVLFAVNARKLSIDVKVVARKSPCL
jgi:hypothetical protein